MIESVETLASVLEPYAGQTVYCEEDEKVYRWDPIEGWQQQTLDGNITMNAYDINRQIIGQLQILDDTIIQEKKENIQQFVYDKKNKYYMLLCRELNYYTLFAIYPKDALEKVEDIVIECANDIGQIKSIELTEDKDAVEIWVSNKDNTHVLYFFPYDAGVVVCG